MNRERISVIIPTYKRCDGLIRAIDSVLNQSYSNIEIVVVDDNDKDSLDRQRVSRIMESYTENENIKYIKHSMNRGGSAARNTGVQMATGRIIAFLDDDDQLLENYLELLYQKMIQSKSKMVFLGNYYKFDGQYTYVRKRKYTKELYSINDVLNGDCLISIFFLIQKELILQCGLFDESLRGYQDCDMWISVSCQTPISVVEEPLAICNRDEAIRVTSNVLQREQALNVLVDKWRGVMSDEIKYSLELFYDKQKNELENQRENDFLFNRNKIDFCFFCKVLGGRYTQAQKIRTLLMFLFGRKGQKYYRWLQFKVFNSKITFFEVANEKKSCDCDNCI